MSQTHTPMSSHAAAHTPRPAPSPHSPQAIDPARPAIGLDVGGTSIKAGLIAADGGALASFTEPTDAAGGPDAVIAQLADLVRRLIERARIEPDAVAGAGVGIPGPVDRERGIVPACVNLPGWRDVPLRDRLEAATGLPIAIENDANAAAFGEFAAARDADPDRHIDHLVLITLGTGVGGGVVLNGQPVGGVAGEAGEIGHLVIDPAGGPCGCGQRGCLETYASASAVIQRTAELDPAAPPATLGEVFDRVGRGDRHAVAAVDRAVDALATACVNLCRLLDPPAIFLGGGMIEAWPRLAQRVDAAVRDRAWNVSPPHTIIAAARLGNRAGVLGAAALARDAARRR